MKLDIQKALEYAMKILSNLNLTRLKTLQSYAAGQGYLNNNALKCNGEQC